MHVALNNSEVCKGCRMFSSSNSGKRRQHFLATIGICYDVLCTCYVENLPCLLDVHAAPLSACILV